MKKSAGLTPIFASLILSFVLIAAILTEWRFNSGHVPPTGSYMTAEVDFIGLDGYRFEWCYITLVRDSMQGTYLAFGSRRVGVIPAMSISSYGIQVSGKSLF